MLTFYLSMIDSDSDKSKFEQLYIKYRNPMLNRAYDILGDRGLAEDAVHNAFLRTVIEEDDSSPTTLEEVYELSYVPEGYVLKQENIYEEKATYIYINGRKDITFSQITRDYYSASIDNKDVDISVEKHDGQDYLVYGIEDGSFIIIYDNGRYVFSLSSYELPKETMIRMLETIKIKKD